MQTFLPYASFADSAGCLHPKHLGNQFYREGLTILRGGWPNHPASKMWRSCDGRDYAGALCRYLFALSIELRRRGKDYPKHRDEIKQRYAGIPMNFALANPPWLGNDDFHAAHRSNLLRKDLEKGWNWYTAFGWTEPLDLPTFGQLRPPKGEENAHQTISNPKTSCQWHTHAQNRALSLYGALECHCRGFRFWYLPLGD